MRDVLSHWPRFAVDAVAAIDAEWTESGSLRVWSKTDESVVSDLDIRLDLAIREVFASHYAGMPVLSEELGWLYAVPTSDFGSAAVVDSIDGTESLVDGQLTWWSSIALVCDGNPIAGLIHQPARHITYDSAVPSNTRYRNGRAVGLSPDRLLDDGERDLRDRLDQAGFSFERAPHSVEKVAAVLEGRCAACISMPSDKSPDWRSWDLAACIAIVRESDVCLLDTEGNPLSLPDLDGRYSTEWICARDRATWDEVRSAWGDRE
jgi:myo-inositol-1(or 4)-monophosphatase